MHGYRKIHRNNASAVFLLIILLVTAGCTGNKETGRIEPPAMSLKEFLDQSEKNFKPSDYDADLGTVEGEARRHRDSVEAALVSATAVPETIPGFRVQVLFTQEIDQANAVRDNLSPQMPEQWVYVVYEAPYYKVRVGNFADRSEAGPILKKLVDLGYKDAWMVPDNVIKNPPPKPPETFIEPEKR